jgi:hypothetical protein
VEHVWDHVIEPDRQIQAHEIVTLRQYARKLLAMSDVADDHEFLKALADMLGKDLPETIKLPPK